MLSRRDVMTTTACAIIIAVLAIIGAALVVYEAIKFIMPILVFIDFVGR